MPPSESPGTWTWAPIEHGLWVAQQHGEFAGMVEEQRAHDYEATNSAGRVIGRFPTLTDAKAGLSAIRSRRESSPLSESRAVPQPHE